LVSPFFIRFIGDIINGVCGIYAHASLDAAADFLAQHTRHILLAMQVFLTLVNMGKTVNLLSGEVRRGSHQTFIFGFSRFVIRGAHNVDAVAMQLVRPINQITIIIDVAFHFR
jgi:hypothetical protein